MLTSESLTALRATLEAERDQLRRQTEGRPDEADFDENFADSGQVAAEQGESRTLASTLTEQLDDVERALVKMDDGTYGTCEISGEPIPLSRLEAVPTARVCIEHAGGASRPT